MKDSLGSFIKENRKKRNIPKKFLCSGICSVTALTRYEENVRTPDKFVADTLLERLGIYPYMYEFITSEQEFHCRQMQKRIDNFIRKNECELAAQEMYVYERSISSAVFSFLHRQYLLLKEAEILRIKKEDGKKTVEILKEALCLTVDVKAVEKNISEVYLSLNEFQAFYWLAEGFMQNGQKQEAKKIFLFLKEYLENRKWDFHKWKKNYPALLYQDACIDYDEGQYVFAWKKLKEAKTLLIQEFCYTGLREILQLEKLTEEKCLSLQDKERGRDDISVLLDIMAGSNQGIITKEGVEIWENTASQQLSDIQEGQEA